MAVAVFEFALAIVRAGKRRTAGEVETGHQLRLRPIHKTNRLNHFSGNQRGHAAVQRLAQVGRPVLRRRQRVQQFMGMGQRRLQIGQRLHFLPGHTINQRQVVGSVGEGDRRDRFLLLERPLQHHLRFMHQGVRPPNGSCGYVS